MTISLPLPAGGAGCQLGNQTSQFFANVYLDSTDQLITRHLYPHPRAYARYVDDLILFAASKPELHAMHEAIRQELAAARLTLHESKSRVYTSAEGISFLGWRVFPNHTRLARYNLIAFCRRMRGRHRDCTRVLRGRVLGQYARHAIARCCGAAPGRSARRSRSAGKIHPSHLRQSPPLHAIIPIDAKPPIHGQSGKGYDSPRFP